MSEYVRSIREVLGHSLLLVAGVTAIITDGRGGLLMMRHRDTRQWVLPGGAVELGEHPSFSVAREVLEETGLNVEVLGIIGVYGGPNFVVHYQNGDLTAYVMTVYNVKVIGGKLESATDEAVELRYVNSEELTGLDVPPWVSEVTKDLLIRGVGA